MANVNFRKGLRAGLPATYSEGTFYVTTDERAIYLDVSDSARIRLGDFQEFATIDALVANTNPSTTALYYVTDINCLAKWNGSEYVQINKDTGMTSVEVTGDGNAVTAAVYSADGRKLTLTKGATYMTEADVDGKVDAAKKEVMDYVGEIPNGYTEETIVAYINKKAEETLSAASGGSTESAASVLAALNTYKAENDPKVTANTEAAAAAQSAADDAAAAAAAAQATADSKVTMAEVEAKGYATTAEAQAMADAKDEAIAEAKAAGDAAQADVDTLKAAVGTPTDGKTVVEMIADAQAAATYDDTDVKADIAENAGAIAAITNDYLKNADKEELAASVQAEADRAEAAEKANADAIAAVKEDVDSFLAAAEIGEAAVDTLKEIQEYITTDGAAADQMVKDISDNKAAIEAEVERATGAESALSARIDTLNGASHDHENEDVLDGITSEKVAAWDGAQAAAEATASAALDSAKSELEGKITAEAERASAAEAKALTDAKAYTDEKDTAMDARVKVLEAIDHDAYKAADETVLSSAKEYADGLNSSIDARVQALEGIDHDAYINYADQAEADAVTTANAYADSLATNYDAAGSAATAETNAKAYADSLVMTWGSF